MCKVLESRATADEERTGVVSQQLSEAQYIVSDVDRKCDEVWNFLRFPIKIPEKKRVGNRI